MPRGGPTWTAEEYHLAHMAAISAEEFDSAYFRTGRNFRQYFDENGASVARNEPVLMSIIGKLRIQVEGIRGPKEALQSYNVFDYDEVSMCTLFLQSMLRLKPSDRATAADLVQHEWLRV